MSVKFYPNLAGQRQFWNVWNATWRDPTSLNAWSLQRGETILKLLASLGLNHPKILDLGCGTGWLTERLADLGPATGVDLAESVIAVAQRRCPHITFLAGDLFQLSLPTNHFDIAVSQEVIAHVESQVAYINCAADVLRAGGYLLITTPNKFVIDRGNWPQQPPEHLEQWLTMHRLKRLLSRRFRVLHTMTILPMGNHGILRLINSAKANAALGVLIPRPRLEALKEWCGLGYTLIALAQKQA